jgi:predicted enzyme related to lactoylglutathione lyase
VTRLLGINVVFVYVADMAGARRFYEEIVGLPAPAVADEDWVQYALPGGADFALHRTTPSALAGGDPARNTVGFSIVVDDLDAFARRAEEQGVALLRGPEKGPGFDLVEFCDPEGNRVRLIRMWASPENA